MSVSIYGQKVLVDAGDRRDSVQSTASSTIRLVRDQYEIVCPCAHVKQRLQLTLGQQATPSYVSNRVFGNALGVQNELRFKTESRGDFPATSRLLCPTTAEHYARSDVA